MWGLLCGGTTDDEPLPDEAEDRLLAFATLVTVAVSTALARDRLRRLPTSLLTRSKSSSSDTPRATSIATCRSAACSSAMRLASPRAGTRTACSASGDSGM